MTKTAASASTASSAQQASKKRPASAISAKAAASPLKAAASSATPKKRAYSWHVYLTRLIKSIYKDKEHTLVKSAGTTLERIAIYLIEEITRRAASYNPPRGNGTKPRRKRTLSDRDIKSATLEIFSHTVAMSATAAGKRAVILFNESK